jgi:hypothetical protein
MKDAEPRDRKPAQVEAEVRRLLARTMSDADLRAELEELARQWAFSGLTWLWGPELYRRNRVLFRPFILAHFGTTQWTGQWKWEQVAWKGSATDVLERWLAEVDKADDVDLFRRLYQWKTQPTTWAQRRDESRILGDLVRRYETAVTAAARAVVLAKFNFGLQLDEESAIRLYTIDPSTAGPYLLQHLPSRWGWGGEKRSLWKTLFDLARQRGDQTFAMQLYRRQVPLTQWGADALALCESTPDAAELCVQLEAHHPEGWGLELGTPVAHLVEARGRDVVPYVLKHLKDIWPRWYGRGGYGKLLDMAYARGWWDLWSGLLRVCAKPEDWNTAVRQLAADRTLSEAETTRRLLLLTGVAREWNFGGFSMAQVQQLEDATAVDLYERFPALVRGPFKLHLQTGFWSSLPKLIDLVVQNQDETLIDFLASRLVNRRNYTWGRGNPVSEAELLADYFEKLRARDPVEFSRRAANVLTQVPAYTFWSYGRTVQDNRLARLLLERSLDSFLGDAAALRDLVEASEIHVQHLAYRVLGLDDDRARTAAVDNLDILIGTLLRPLHRTTRLAAFGALKNAALASLPSARQIVERGRDALALPDKKYPKERLLALIGTILHRWPELRTPAEEPVIYRTKEAVV